MHLDSALVGTSCLKYPDLVGRVSCIQTGTSQLIYRQTALYVISKVSTCQGLDAIVSTGYSLCYIVTMLVEKKEMSM